MRATTTYAGATGRLLVGLGLAAMVLLAAPGSTAAQQPCGGFYTIRPGDSLADIAVRCATTIPALLAANPAVQDEQDLEPGGRVRIPPPGAGPTPVQACGGFYTLRSGDTLEEVAAKCGLTVPLLLAVNPSLEDPENVQPGGVVRIPDLPPVGAFAAPPIVIPPVATEPVGADPALTDTAAAEPFARHEGTLVDGERCTLLRTAGGELVGLVGRLGSSFGRGDRVVVTGPAIGGGACGTRTAIQVRILWKPGP